MDLDLMMAALIRDGRTLHADWAGKETAEAQVVAGTIRMFAQATIPESVEDPRLEGSTATHEELSRVIRDSSLSGDVITAKALTFFHSAASLVAMLRGDWSRARRQGEFAMILSDLCSFPSFLAAWVVACSSAVSGNTQYSVIAEKFLALQVAMAAGLAPGSSRRCTWSGPSPRSANLIASWLGTTCGSMLPGRRPPAGSTSSPCTPR